MTKAESIALKEYLDVFDDAESKSIARDGWIARSLFFVPGTVTIDKAQLHDAHHAILDGAYDAFTDIVWKRLQSPDDEVRK